MVLVQAKAANLTDKRIVNFELRTVKDIKKDEVDFDLPLLEKMKK